MKRWPAPPNVIQPEGAAGADLEGARGWMNRPRREVSESRGAWAPSNMPIFARIA